MILFASEYVCIQRICIFHHHDFSDWLNISVYLELSLVKLWLGPAKTMPCHKYPCQGLIVISINTFVLYFWHCIFFHLYFVFVFCEPSNVLSQVYKCWLVLLQYLMSCQSESICPHGLICYLTLSRSRTSPQQKDIIACSGCNSWSRQFTNILGYRLCNL